MATQLTLDGEEVPHEREGHQDPSTADPKKLGYVGSVTRSTRDSDAWFTPEKYVAAARVALGGAISLDPFSSAEANKVVKADRFFTESDNAFKREWFPQAREASAGRRTVWMNPPYGAGLVSDAMNLFLNEFAAGTFDAGIILVNNATETKWFQRALSSASGLALTDHRISFWNSDGKAVSGNTRGQAFFYFGTERDGFVEVFSAFGFSTPLGTTLGISRPHMRDEQLPLTF